MQGAGSAIVCSKSYGHCAALIYYRSGPKRSMTTYLQRSNGGIRPRGNGPLSICGSAGERPLRTANVSARPSARRPSLGAWAPNPITVNHRPRQFFARACNRDGVIDPANSLDRSLLGTQDVAMLGGVVAFERVCASRERPALPACAPVRDWRPSRKERTTIRGGCSTSRKWAIRTPGGARHRM